MENKTFYLYQKLGKVLGKMNEVNQSISLHLMKEGIETINFDSKPFDLQTTIRNVVI